MHTVKSLRKHRAWSQSHLAEVADISVRTVQRFERTGVCSDETMLAMAAALGVEVSSLHRTFAVPETEIDLEMLPGISVTGRQAVAWGAVLVLPTALFISSNLLKFHFDAPGLFEFFIRMGEFTRLDQLSAFLIHPLLLLGGPFIAVILALLAQVHIIGKRAQGGFQVSGIHVAFHPGSAFILLLAASALVVLISYVAFGNLAEWIIEMAPSR